MMSEEFKQEYKKNFNNSLYVLFFMWLATAILCVLYVFIDAFGVFAVGVLFGALISTTVFPLLDVLFTFITINFMRK